jgi:penicillin amidase
VSEFYEFYRKLALWTLDQANPGDPELADARAAITGWNGRLDPDSKGIGFLVQWRKALARAVFAPIVRRGRALDGSFTYRWKQQETPLRALLSERLPETLPDRRRGDWPGFLLAVLRETLGELKRDFPGQTLKELRWGEIERITIRHPFSASIPAAGWLLDMPAVEGGCNSFCLKVLHGAHGASERMVISPNHPEDGLLQMPGGQSGHPLSPFYGDQQRAWAEGAPSPFLPGPAQHRLSLSP